MKDDLWGYRKVVLELETAKSSEFDNCIIYVTGNCEHLGNFEKPVEMKRSLSDSEKKKNIRVWKTDIFVDVEQHKLKYKYLIKTQEDTYIYERSKRNIKFSSERKY